MDRLLATPLSIALLAGLVTAQAATAPSVKITGRVVLWDGRPVAGAAVECCASRSTDTNALLRDAKVTTDAEGRFVLQAAPPTAAETDARVVHVAAKGMAAVVQRVPWKRKTGGDDSGGDGDDNGVPVDLIVEDDGGGEAPAPKAAEAVEYEAEAPLEDIVLTTGHRLFGRVRDAAGKPLAGVRIVATDLLEQGNSFRFGRRLGFHCAAASEPSGIFSLPSALPLGARLEFSLDGWFGEVLQPVAAGTPLEVTLRPSGWIQGRVLDRDGRSIADANVTVHYELRATPRPVRTGADGSFRLGLERPGRWRLFASKSADKVSIEGRTDVLEGPRENLELLVESKTATAAESLTVRAVVKQSGKPVTVFQAAAVWEQYANQNYAYLDYRLRSQLRSAPRAQDGAAQVPGPGKHGSPTGAIRVVAAGFAPATRKDVEWKEPEAGQPPTVITLELEAEATISGTLRDERTGEPVAGAKVFARPRQDPNQGRYDDGDANPKDAVTSAADGTFRIAGLGEGGFEVVVRDPKRPRAPATEVELATAEQKTGVVITVPSGAAVSGKLQGTTIGHGLRVFLHRLPRQTFGDSNRYYSYWNGQQVDDRGVPVQPDGSFRIEGVALDNHLLVMRLPSPPRLGGDLYLPLEPFRVRSAGVDRAFDCGEDRPGQIRGRITFPAASVPFEQVIVIASLVPDEEAQQFFSPFDTNYAGPRAFVAGDGTFDVRVGPGAYQLRAVDMATGVLLHSEDKKIPVPAGGATERNMTIELQKVELELAAAADVQQMAAVERVELRVVPKAMKAMAAQFGGNDNYDSGTGLWWPRGETRCHVVLPLGDAVLLCRNNVAQLRIDDERWNNAPLGRAEFEVATGAGAKTACKIEVGGPPEIPDPKKDEKKDGQDATEAAPGDLQRIRDQR